MTFATTPQDQLKELNTLFPQGGYTTAMDPFQITREYRKLVMRGVLVNLIDKNACKPGNSDSKKFELAHIEILKWTLAQEFPGEPEYQNPSHRLDQLKQNIRDITFQIPGTEQTTEWESIKQWYNLKSIVFECKNYSETNPISYQEIYQLFEYINPDEHGFLGIILSRYGKMDLSAKSAIAKISGLKGEKYKILVFSDDDIISMIDSFIETGSYAKFLYQQIGKSRNHPR